MTKHKIPFDPVTTSAAGPGPRRPDSTSLIIYGASLVPLGMAVYLSAKVIRDLDFMTLVGSSLPLAIFIATLWISGVSLVAVGNQRGPCVKLFWGPGPRRPDPPPTPEDDDTLES
jgi:hypothetical protein